MIITIDGPVASGKSTIARALAVELDYIYIYSGMLFRAVAYWNSKRPNCENDSIENFNKMAIAKLFSEGVIKYVYSHKAGAEIFVDNINVTKCLKNSDIDQKASKISANPCVRQVVLEFQRNFANDYNVLADGRDCGTVVFPNADYKFFLTASLQVRALRYQKEAANRDLTLKECEQMISERDARDSSREASPLKPAHDAMIVDTSDMTVQEVIQMIYNTIKL